MLGKISVFHRAFQYKQLLSGIGYGLNPLKWPQHHSLSRLWGEPWCPHAVMLNQDLRCKQIVVLTKEQTVLYIHPFLGWAGGDLAYIGTTAWSWWVAHSSLSHTYITPWACNIWIWLTALYTNHKPLPVTRNCTSCWWSPAMTRHKYLPAALVYTRGVVSLSNTQASSDHRYLATLWYPFEATTANTTLPSSFEA